MCMYVIPFYCYSASVERALARPLFIGEAALTVKSLTNFVHQGKFIIIRVLVELTMNTH